MLLKELPQLVQLAHEKAGDSWRKAVLPLTSLLQLLQTHSMRRRRLKVYNRN